MADFERLAASYGLNKRHADDRQGCRDRTPSRSGVGRVPQVPINLQRSAGNRATTSLMRRLGDIAANDTRVSAPPDPTSRRSAIAHAPALAVQRLPSHETVVDTLGKPHRLPTESTKYKQVLSCLDDYNKYLLKTFDPAAYRKQFSELIRLLGRLKAAARAYPRPQADDTDAAKARYMWDQLLPEIAKEQQLVNKALAGFLTALPPAPPDRQDRPAPISPPYNAPVNLYNLLLWYTGRPAPSVGLAGWNRVASHRAAAAR